MKVIEKGKPEKSWPRQHRTPCCDSILELEPSDIKRSTDYLGGHNGYFIDCPVCGEQPWVKDSLHASAQNWIRQQARIQS